jgi:hypothetical protein
MLVLVLPESIPDSIIKVIFCAERIEGHVKTWLAIDLENHRTFEVVFIV